MKRRSASATALGAIALSAIALSLVLTSCSIVPTSLVAQVPTSGPVQQGQLISNTSADQFIRVIARPPRPGMTPTEIVQGFLDSSASFDSNHAVARSYLTPEAGEQWNPADGVTVYDGVPSFSEAGAAVLMSATLNGRISDIGRFTVEKPGTEQQTSFFLTQRGGEWRISRAPRGLLLSSFDVNRAYRSYSVYFFNPGFDTLVPDPRLIPVVGPALATTLIQKLIAGPNSWLLPAVRTGFPDGVALNVDAVPIDGGIAQVNLNAVAALANDNARTAMSQQIVWTLRQLPEVSAVDITIGGTPMSVPGVLSPQSRDAWGSVDPSGLSTTASGYASTGAGVVRLTTEGNFAIGGELGQSAIVDDTGGEFRALAVDRDGATVSALTAGGELVTSRTLIGSPAQVLDVATDARSIAFDLGDALWAVDDRGAAIAIAPSGESYPIEVRGLTEGDSLLALIPSRDGARAALIVQRGSGSILLLARVQRPSAANLSRIVIADPIRVESKLTSVNAATWSSANTVAVLGSESAGALQGYEIDLGRGEIVGQGAPADPVSIAAAPGLPTLIGSADGFIYENSTGSWSTRIPGFSPAYPD